MTEVARDRGIDTNTLHRRWRREFQENKTEAFPGKGRLVPAVEYLRRVERELANFKEERDIFKKHWASFYDRSHEASVHS